MRATTRIRNLRYVIEPMAPQITPLGKQIGVTQGLTVQFIGNKEGFFDSESVKNEAHRFAIEDFLRHHEDRGVLYHIEGEPTGEANIPQPIVEEDTPDPATAVCIATVVVPGEPSQLCGKPADPDTHLCEDHEVVEAGV